jgi:hypothetical protein
MVWLPEGKAMSFTLEIRAGDRSYMTEIPADVVYGFATLEKTGHAKDVHLLIGEGHTPPGEERTLSRQALVDAVERLQVPANQMGNGFRVRADLSFGDHREIAGPGRAGILIDGVYFGVRCSDDHWVMSPSQPTPGKTFPPEMRGVHRYEPAEIQSENMGIVKVERKKGKRKILINFLNSIQEFLREAKEEDVAVTVG